MEVLASATEPRSERLSRSLSLGLASLAALGTLAITLNHWVQRDWLGPKWLYKQPRAYELLWASSAVALAAWVATCAAWRAGRARGSAWPALRWGAPAVLALWVSLWWTTPPVIKFDAQLALCMTAAVWNTLLACAAWRASTRWPRWLRTVELVVMELALSVFAAELALRVLRSTTDSQLFATSGVDVDTWLRSHRREPGQPYLGFPANSEGMVDDEPAALGAGQPWIACVGDSFSVGVVPHHRHYTTLAERELGLPVYNIGVVNAGPREYLRMLQSHAVPRSPRLIVVALFLGNDLSDSERPRPTMLQSLIDREEALVRVLPRRWMALRRQRRETEPPAADGLPLRAVDALGTPEELERRMPWLADPQAEQQVFTRERYLYIEQSRTWMCFPDQVERYRTLYEYLLRIRAAAGDVPVACLLFPDEFQVEDWLWDDLLADGLDPNAQRDLPQREVGAWLERNGFPYADLLPRLRAVEPGPDGRRHVYHLHDTHFNARGNALAAEALAELARRCGVAR